MDRRHFLRTSAGAAAGLIIAGCDHTASITQPSTTTTALTESSTTTSSSPAATTVPVETTATTSTVATTATSTTSVTSTAATPPTDVSTTTTAVAPTTTAAAVPHDLDALAATLQGRVVRPGDADYNPVRLLECTMFDGVQPMAVIVVSSADDVGRVIAYARANNVPFAVRSGGHAYAGWSTGAGLVIDTRGLAGVGALTADGTASIGAGTQLIDVYATLAAQGVAVAGGSCATVGFSGLALGGGHGFTSRAYGLACDAVVAMEVVTADGVVHQCDENNDADLFWACRGGGGSFGVVTKMIVKPHPLPPVATTFELTYSWHNAADALARWMQWVPSLPGATMTAARLQNGSSLQLIVLGLHLGPVAEAKQVLAPMLAGMASSSIGARAFVDALMLEAGCTHRTLTACHNAGISAGGTLLRQTPFAASSHYFGAPLGGAAIAVAMSAVQHRAAHADTATMQFDSYGGAIASVAADATAFVHRNAFCSAQYGSYFTTGDGTGDRAWIRSTRAVMEPFSNGEAYQNYVDPELDGWAQAYYGANLARLQTIKRAVDPDNVFTWPQSIPLT